MHATVIFHFWIWLTFTLVTTTSGDSSSIVAELPQHEQKLAQFCSHMEVMTWSDEIFLRDTICDDIASSYHRCKQLPTRERASVQESVRTLRIIKWKTIKKTVQRVSKGMHCQNRVTLNLNDKLERASRKNLLKVIKFCSSWGSWEGDGWRKMSEFMVMEVMS